MEFVKNREGWLVSATQRQCTNCMILFDKCANDNMRICKTCNTERVKSQSVVMKMHRRAKVRAKNKSIEFSIEPSDITIPDVCPILGIELFCTSGRSGAFRNSPSLDKIDPNRGYTKDNIWVISQMANTMKSNASIEDLKKFAEWISTLQ